MASKGTSGESYAKAILAALLQMGGAGGMAGFIAGGGAGRVDDIATGEYPSPLHTVNVKYVGGKVPQLNAGLRKNIAEQAGRMQTIKEHNDALNKPLLDLLKRNPNATAREKHLAIVQGAEDEANLLSYWDDKKPRKNYAGRSSAIRAIRITPDHRVQVQWGTTPKWYSYRAHANAYEASLAAQRLLMSNSLGRSVLPGKGFFSLEENDDSMRPSVKK